MNLNALFNLNYQLFWTYLNGLSENTSLVKVIQLRKMDYSEIKDPQLIKAKRKFELKREKNTIQQNLNAFADILINKYQSTKEKN